MAFIVVQNHSAAVAGDAFTATITNAIASPGAGKRYVITGFAFRVLGAAAVLKIADDDQVLHADSLVAGGETKRDACDLVCAVNSGIHIQGGAASATIWGSLSLRIIPEAVA